MAVLIASGGSAGWNRLRVAVSFSGAAIQCRRSLLDVVAG
jgi:hypothetical protein